MTTLRRNTIAVAALVSAGAAGWLSVSGGRTPAAPATQPQVDEIDVATVEAPAPVPSTASAVSSPARRVTQDIQLTAQELEYLRHDPEQWARDQLESTRELRNQMCKARLHDPTPELCDRIFRAFTRVTPKYLGLQKRFLSGEIDQDQYQTEFHRIMLEQTVDLESAMSPREYYAYLSVPPGEDLFIDLNGGLERMESIHFKMGDEILDREVQK